MIPRSAAMMCCRCLLIALLAFVAGAPGFAQDDENAIKERLRARVAQVDDLKLEGKVGENNQGLLEQRASLSTGQTEIMNAENADRRALYNILAAKLGLTAAVVGQGRAEQLRRNSAAGVWVQEPDGSWRQK